MPSEKALVSRTVTPHADGGGVTIEEVWDATHPDSPFVVVSGPKELYGRWHDLTGDDYRRLKPQPK